jgi:hypothetical protein
VHEDPSLDVHPGRRGIDTCGVPDTLGIPADVGAGAGAVNYVSSITTTVNGVVALASTGVDAGNNPLVITMTPAMASGSLDWSLSGNGCTDTGRSINRGLIAWIYPVALRRRLWRTPGSRPYGLLTILII